LLSEAPLCPPQKARKFVFILRANADVRFVPIIRAGSGTEPIATFNVLEASRLNGVKRLAFSSTGSVYGEAAVIPTPEDAPFPIQTSLYGRPSWRAKA